MSDPSPRVSDQELTTCLETELSRHFGAHRRIAALTRRRSEYCTSFSIEELEVRFEDDAELNLLFKDLSAASLSPDARRIRPKFVYDLAREILVYRDLLAGAGLGTAACYGSCLDAGADRYWLFLEKVSGVELYQVGDIAVWQTAAAWLARMHAAVRSCAIERADAVRLRKYDRGGYSCWMDRARDFLSRGTDSKPPIAARIEWLASCYGRVVERLLELPTTLIHGEFYASNVLIGQTPASLDGLNSAAIRVCPVDWETAAIAPGPIDLAALTAGKWSDEQRSSLAAAYQEAWSSQGGLPAATPDVLESCRLFLAVQWMGWAADWAPPAEHANDWLGEALELAERL